MSTTPTTAIEGVLDHCGSKLSYRVRGSGDPVVLIQGVGLHGDGWLPQVESLAPRYSCLTFDNRGMGASQPAGSPLTIEQFADDVRALMDKLGWQRAHLVGHSMGGLIAQCFALQHPQRTRSLTLLCTIAKGKDATRLSATMFWLGLRSRIGTKRRRRLAFLEIVLPKGVLATADRERLAREFAPLFGHDLGDQPPIVMRQLSAMSAYNALPSLPRLASIPTLVVAAEHDLIAKPEYGRALAQAIPGAKYVELPAEAHGVPIYRQELINGLLFEHLNSIR